MKYSLIGINGNAFSIMGYVEKAMKGCGCSKDAIDAYLNDAMSSDYDHLLSVSIGIINKCNGMLEA